MMVVIEPIWGYRGDGTEGELGRGSVFCRRGVRSSASTENAGTCEDVEGAGEWS